MKIAKLIAIFLIYLMVALLEWGIREAMTASAGCLNWTYYGVTHCQGVFLSFSGWSCDEKRVFTGYELSPPVNFGKKKRNIIFGQRNIMRGRRNLHILSFLFCICPKHIIFLWALYTVKCVHFNLLSPPPFWGTQRLEPAALEGTNSWSTRVPNLL